MDGLENVANGSIMTFAAGQPAAAKKEFAELLIGGLLLALALGGLIM